MESVSYDLNRKVTEEYLVDMVKIEKVICYVKENYIRNHIARYGTWPPCNIEETAPRALIRAHELGIDPNTPRHVCNYGPVSIDAYSAVDLQSNMLFIMLENAIPYLKNKTISLMRNRVFAEYINKLEQQQSSGHSWKDTRLLLAYLLNPAQLQDRVDYIKRYDQSPTLEELTDYLVIRVVPKEKELKVQYRGFGCKTLEDRFRSLAQEKNAMRYLDEYSHEQAMSLSELDLVKKRHVFRNLYKAYRGHRILYVLIHAKAWNNHFRRVTVDVVVRETSDRIFSVNIFSKTHLAYQRTLVYIPNGQQGYYWQGQDGGIEGLNQGTWVIVYIAQIKTPLEGYRTLTIYYVKGMT